MIGKRLLGALALMLAGMSTNVMAETVILTTPQDYQIMGISPNGKWACGVYVDFSYSVYAFRWNLETGSIELLSSTSESQASSVANDGTVVGQFMDTGVQSTYATMEMPGYYKNGKWNSVELPEGADGDGMGHGGITADGHYISGSVKINGVYTPVIWKDGKVHRVFYNGLHGDPYCISPDGQAVGGWAYKLGDQVRFPAYWDANGNRTILSDYGSPFCLVQKFSPDGKKLLIWGGWNSEKEEDSKLLALYDIATGEKTWIPTIKKDAEFGLSGISGNYTLVGHESDRAYINVGGEGLYAEDYLKDKGVDFSTTDVLKTDDSDYYMLISAHAISEDDNCIGLRYYDTEGAIRSMVVMFNRDLTHVAPVEIAARQLAGIGCVCLTWKVPVGIKDIKGYNIYRGEQKMNTELVDVQKYYDGDLADGTYAYTVSAVYADGTEVKADPVEVTVAPKALSAPGSLLVRQKGVNSIYAQWETPATNLISKGYTDIETANIQGFGVNNNGQAFEVGIKFDKEDLAYYSDSKLTGVTFYPMAKDATNWKVNIYTRNADGALSLIKSQAITQTLKYQSLNTVKLDEPVTLPAGDLIVAIETTVGKASASILGMDFGRYQAGYSDLIRQVSESDFYSLVETSTAQGYPYFTSWLLNAVLTPEGSAADIDDVDHYTVYVDGSKKAETSERSYVIDGMADGSHVFGVDVTYTGARTSAVVDASVDIAANYKNVTNVAVAPAGEAKVDVSWTAPADDDLTTVSYASGAAADRSVKGPDTNNYGIMAGALYPAAMLNGYAGYRINSFRFYPLADATFTFYLIENDTQVCEFEVNNYVLGQWNTVNLPSPVTINAGSSYQLVLDCYDVTPDQAPLAVDRNTAFDFYSNLYSLDGSSWGSITEAAINGSWMMGLTMVAPNPAPVNVSGYDVFVDGAKRNQTMLTEPKFAYDFGTDNGEQHSVRVDTWYPSATVSIEGDTKYFTFQLITGIGGNTVEKLDLKFGANSIRIEGEGVESVSVYGMNGVKAASAAGNTLDISNLASGVYVVKVKAATGDMTRKIEVRR